MMIPWRLVLPMFLLLVKRYESYDQSMLFRVGLVKHPNMQLPSKYCGDVLGVLTAPHLSAGECCC